MKQSLLDQILENKRNEVQLAKEKNSLESLQHTLSDRKTEIRNFFAALGTPSRLHVIAEIKKASPSEKVIEPNFNPLEIALLYQNSGLVDAISILTDEKYFSGKLSYIRDIKNITKVPLFRKDFIIDEYQIYESYLAEADAILLIAHILEPVELQNLIQLTKKLGLQCLVETRNKAEIEMAVQAGTEIIGINARNLDTLEMNKHLFADLVSSIPTGILKVAESGLESSHDLQEVAAAGADAVLIGTTLMRAKNKKAKLEELLSFERAQ